MASLHRLSTRLSSFYAVRNLHFSIAWEAYSSSSAKDPGRFSEVADTKVQTVRITSNNDYNSLIDSAKNKAGLNKYEQFTSVLNEFYIRDKHRRGHLAFIRTAVQKMDDFGLEKDLITYNKIVDIFPRGRFRPKRFLDSIWPVPHPQLELCLDILTKMEEQGVRPSTQTYDILREIFGRPSLPLDKCVRIMYLFDKFADIDPYEIRLELPKDPMELSRLALFRMTGEGCQLMEVQVPEIGAGYVLGGNSERHLKLLEDLKEKSLSSDTFLHVDGPHRIWLKKVRQFYFTLKMSKASGSEAESEGVVLGMCMCQPYSLERLQNWVGLLQDKYPTLSSATVIYDIDLST